MHAIRFSVGPRAQYQNLVCLQKGFFHLSGYCKCIRLIRDARDYFPSKPSNRSPLSKNIRPHISNFLYLISFLRKKFSEKLAKFPKMVALAAFFNAAPPKPLEAKIVQVNLPLGKFRKVKEGSERSTGISGPCKWIKFSYC